MTELSDLGQAALRYAELDLAVFPLAPGTKRPLRKGGHNIATTDPETVRRWWSDRPDANIGVNTARLAVLDVDDKGVRRGSDDLDRLTSEHGNLPATVETLTPTGGRHLWFRQGRDPLRKCDLADGVELKADGSYVVAPPSVLGDGGRYEFEASSDLFEGTEIAQVPAWVEQRARDSVAKRAAPSGSSPHGLTVSTVELLVSTGAKVVRTEGGEVYLRRPLVGGEREADIHEIGGCVGHVSPGTFHCFSSSWPPFETEGNYGFDKVWRMVGDYDEWLTEYVASMDTAEPPSADPSSWLPADLEPIYAGTYRRPKATLLTRNDGESLLYPQRVNDIHGEPESGKTWVVLEACAQEIRADRRIVYIDFEDDAGSVTTRMLSLGLTVDQLRHGWIYINPTGPLTPADAEQLRQLLTTVQPSLVTLDGVTEVMALHNLDPDKNVDIAAFMERLPKWIVRVSGAGVVLIDHVVKNADSRGRWSIGGQHKLAAVTGTSLHVSVVEPFGHGRTGRSTLRVAKDKAGGRVRAIQDDDGRVADVELVSVAESYGVAVVLSPPDGQRGDASRPVKLMERISNKLADFPNGLNTRALREAVGGRGANVDLAVAVLEQEGYVKVERQGTSRMHTLLCPYRSVRDPKSPDYDPEAPTPPGELRLIK